MGCCSHEQPIPTKTACTPEMKSGCPCCGGGTCTCGPGCKCRAAGMCCDTASSCATTSCATDKSDKCCPVKKCMSAFIGGLLAAMVMFLFEGFWHGQYLMPFYLQTHNIWRPMADMQALMGWYIGVLVAMGLILSLIFSKNYECKGLPEGVRFGFYIGLLLGVSHMGAFVHLPIPINLAVLWLCGWIIEGVLVGVTLSLTYMAFDKKAGLCGSAKKSCS